MSLLVLSDQHLGSWGKKRERNAAALDACVSMAIREDAKIVLNGDVVDNLLMNRKGMVVADDVDTDTAIMQNALQRFQRETGKKPIFIRGNHEGFGFHEGCLNDEFQHSVDFDFRETVTMEEDSVLHHGQYLDAGRILGEIGEVRDALEKVLRGEMEIYDLLNLLNSKGVEMTYWRRQILRDYFIQGVTTLAKILRQYRKIVASGSGWLNKAKKDEQAQHEELSRRFVEERILDHKEPNNMTHNAAMLACAVNQPVAIVGHDHRARVVKRWVFDCRTEELKPIIVANSGTPLKRDFTAVFLDSAGKDVSLLAYDEAEREILTKTSLSYAEQDLLKLKIFFS